MRAMYRRILISLLVITCLIVPLATVSNAHSMFDLYTDEATGWQTWNHRHMGSKYTTYSYANNPGNFLDEIQDGIAMWGSYINFTEASNSMGRIELVDDGDLYPAATLSTYSSQGHVTSWTMTISIPGFRLEVENNNGAVVIAHEIGHIYGLNHVTRTIDIMYNGYTGNQRVSSFDKLGMMVMTHTHMHNDETTYAIQQHSVTQHRKRCETCYAFYLVNCTCVSDWSDGTNHYYKYDCICGNQALRKVPYTGSILSHQQETIDN